MSAEFERMYQLAKNSARDAALAVEPDYYCGFAWVTLKPATSAFARFCKQKGYAHRGTYGGLEFSIYPALEDTRHAHTQSMWVKEHAALAFAKTLSNFGLDARAQCRAD